MAVTSIWRVNGGGLGKVVDYAKNPDKTTNPEYPAEQTAAGQKKWLSDVINYATQHNKTRRADRLYH